MFTTKEKGDKGEELAVAYLQEKGYRLLEKNYRFKRAEIDLILQRGNTLVFVEVKYRTSLSHGFPEDAVQAKKIELLQSAAEEFVYSTSWLGDIRFDIISIVEQANCNDIVHFEDAF